MYKPKPAQIFVVLGILLQFVGTVIFAFALPASFRSYSGSGAVAGVLFGAFLLLLGLILLLIGVSRALAGIDYLVSVAPNPKETQNNATSGGGDASRISS